MFILYYVRKFSNHKNDKKYDQLDLSILSSLTKKTILTVTELTIDTIISIKSLDASTLDVFFSFRLKSWSRRTSGIKLSYQNNSRYFVTSKNEYRPSKNIFQIILFISLSQHRIICHLQTWLTLVFSNIFFYAIIILIFVFALALFVRTDEKVRKISFDQ